MKFPEVIPYLLEGKRARMTEWDSGVYIAFDEFNGDILSWFVPRAKVAWSVYTYEIDPSDFVMDSWEILPERCSR